MNLEGESIFITIEKGSLREVLVQCCLNFYKNVGNSVSVKMGNNKNIDSKDVLDIVDLEAKLEAGRAVRYVVQNSAH